MTKDIDIYEFGPGAYKVWLKGKLMGFIAKNNNKYSIYSPDGNKLSKSGYISLEIAIVKLKTKFKNGFK